MSRILNKKGQSTVEFALITAGFVGLIIGLGALWNVLETGLFVEHALASASHHVQEVSVGVVGDVFLY
ncbi:MAG: hypothetical protein ACOYD7_06470 [Raoultibacter sp.]|jgi:Flp pilus assembly protein TadG